MRCRLLSLLLVTAVGAPACVGIADEPWADLDRTALTAGADGGAASVAPPIDPCAGVSCVHGACVATGGSALCRCDAGFHLEAGACVADDPCAGVTCAAHSHCQAGPCACDTGFAPDPAGGCTPVPGARETAARAELVAIATAELGHCEGAVVRPYMLSQPGLWCYDFVAWVYAQATTPLPTPLSLPVYRVGNLPPGWHPRAGDLIKYTYQHYGMVESVSADGLSITTLEGNVGSCVTRRGATVASLEYVGSLESSF